MWAHPFMGYRPGTRLRIVKALYGLKNSANDWNRLVTEEIKRMGFKTSSFDPCFFFKMSDAKLVAPLLLLHVDDFGVSGIDSVVESTMCVLDEKFGITRDRNPTTYTSLEFNYNREKGQVVIHQKTAVQNVVRKHGMEQATPVPTPAVKEVIVRKNATKEEKDQKEQKAYTKKMQRIVGDLNFLLILTRPDIVSPSR